MFNQSRNADMRLSQASLEITPIDILAGLRVCVLCLDLVQKCGYGVTGDSYIV